MEPAGRPAPPSWSWRSARGAIRMVFERRLLRRTTPIALAVGIVLSLINQGHVLLAGEADAGTWIRIGANFLVPFIVSNLGALAATKR